VLHREPVGNRTTGLLGSTELYSHGRERRSGRGAKGRRMRTGRAGEGKESMTRQRREERIFKRQ